MKFLLKASHANEYWDCDHFLVELETDDVKWIRDRQAKCMEFFNSFGGDRHGIHASFYYNFGPTGCYSFQNIPDGHYEAELDDRGWAQMPDDADLSDDEYAPTDLRRITFWADGAIYFECAGKYSSDTAEAELPKEILDMVEKEDVAAV